MVYKREQTRRGKKRMCALKFGRTKRQLKKMRECNSFCWMTMLAQLRRKKFEKGVLMPWPDPWKSLRIPGYEGLSTILFCFVLGRRRSREDDREGARSGERKKEGLFLLIEINGLSLSLRFRSIEKE